MCSPSINRLGETAKALGEYLLNQEWDLLQDEFELYWDEQPHLVDTFEAFEVWVKGYMYYNALSCTKLGNADDIRSELLSDYTELKELVCEDLVVTDEAGEYAESVKSSTRFIAEAVMREEWEGLVEDFYHTYPISYATSEAPANNDFAEWLEQYSYINALRSWCMGDKDLEEFKVKETYDKLAEARYQRQGRENMAAGIH